MTSYSWVRKWSAFHVDCGTLNGLAIIDLITQMVLLYNPRALPGCDDTRHGRVFFCGWLAQDPHQWCW